MSKPTLLEYVNKYGMAAGLRMMVSISKYNKKEFIELAQKYEDFHKRREWIMLITAKMTFDERPEDEKEFLRECTRLDEFAEQIISRNKDIVLSEI